MRCGEPGRGFMAVGPVHRHSELMVDIISFGNYKGAAVFHWISFLLFSPIISSISISLQPFLVFSTSLPGSQSSLRLTRNSISIIPKLNTLFQPPLNQPSPPQHQPKCSPRSSSLLSPPPLWLPPTARSQLQLVMPVATALLWASRVV